ncbi:lytic polysaccharide monooxygenase [Streptomyces sp. HU2014]|uniref:LPXTG-domain-containing protein cell wall anchor domain LPXTG-domain-containing protein cell wall anchor doma n=1 Tax=Streptomyces albireticuli TaxID=1940 RepID=A0A1Z2LC22_9ACTN|nr:MULTISPECIES: lytic polysaccharide monooxygenase [Streptomyces]ARZ71846.1 LPXTG-domain-containing protein cell wall anchor domain LPXTG-domain-containing protein cell wall anchor doma [Streptomyces albireticuli]UQI45268.1 lytic polysaccharide monooxygenase [Streptomyces sp. HU2014]
MHPMRRTVRISLLSLTPLALATLTAGPAAAHGSMTDPVSRVSACFAEGPESPDSAACKAMVAAGGTQPLYDWNEVNIGDAAGRHRQIIPDGKLCSAGRDKYKGLDMARTDWPGTKLAPGAHTFRYRATAPHRGTFELYITKDGYDPAKPLKWSDLEAKPFAKVTDPTLKDGSYVIDGTVPKRSGRHLIYSVWQRSDSPEAFYTCSDVDLGGKASAPAPGTKASAPSEKQIAEEAARSTVDHGGHGGDGPGEGGHGAVAHGGAGGEAPESGTGAGVGNGHQQHYAVKAANAPAAQGGRLAETGGDSSTTVLAAGGAAVLAAGSATLFLAMRRRSARNRA